MKSYVVLGLGRFGSEISQQLYKLGNDVLVIDRNSKVINAMADKVTRAASADGMDINVLKSLGVAECDCAIVAIGDDLANSVLCAMNLKKLGVPKVVCKAHDDTHREILEKLGVDEVIFPEREIAAKVARSYSTPNILEQIELSDDYGIIERTAPKSWVGKTLRELNIRTEYAVSVIAAKESNGEVTVSPTADFKVNDKAALLMIGKYKDLNAIEKA